MDNIGARPRFECYYQNIIEIKHIRQQQQAKRSKFIGFFIIIIHE